MSKRAALKPSTTVVPAKTIVDGVWTTDRRGESHEVRFGTMRIAVHGWVGYPSSQLFVTCHEVRLERKALLARADEVDAAKAEALRIARGIVADWHARLSAVSS